MKRPPPPPDGDIFDIKSADEALSFLFAELQKANLAVAAGADARDCQIA